MKVLATICFVTFFMAAQAALTTEQKTKLKQLSEDCIASSGVDKTLIERARNKDFVEDEKLMKYYHCVMKKMGFQCEEGLHADVMKQKLPNSVDPKEGAEVIDKCVNVDKNLSQEWIAYKVYKCFIESINKPVSFFN